MEFEDKEVFFHLYCRRCENENVKETEDPCNECLEHPSNVHSHKPINFKEKE